MVMPEGRARCCGAAPPGRSVVRSQLAAGLPLAPPPPSSLAGTVAVCEAGGIVALTGPLMDVTWMVDVSWTLLP